MSSQASAVNVPSVNAGSAVGPTYVMGVVGGRYETSPTAVTNGQVRGIQINSTGVVAVNAAISGVWTVRIEDTNGATIAVGQTTMSASIPVAIASDQTAIKVKLEDGNGVSVPVGQAAMAASLPVTIASNQSSLNITQVGKAQANAPVNNVYSSTNVLTSAWVQLVASLSGAVTSLEIFDTSGQIMEIGVGGSGSEVAQFFVPQGGNGLINFAIASGARVSVRALSETANVGNLIMNFYT